MINHKYNQLDNILLVILFFLISSDIFFNVYEFPTIRLSQIIITYLIFSYFFINFNDKLNINRDIKILFLFCIINFIFIPNSGFITKGLGYSVWLFLNILLLAYICQYINLLNYLVIIKLFLNSILFVSIFGLIQFIAGIFGFGGNFGIVMWWIPDILPRINSFSYEPSFLASYLICGWVTLIYCHQNTIYLYNKYVQLSYLIIISSVMILSGSRIALIMMILWFLRNIFINLIKFISLKNINLKVIYTYVIFSLIFIILFLIFYNFDDNTKLILLNGTGLLDTSNHSIIERLSGFYKIIELIYDSPILGYSLGGLSYHLALKDSIVISDFESSKIEGNGILFEIFSATGIFGFLVFIYFLYRMYSKFKFVKNSICLDYKIRHIFIGFSLGLLFQFIAIQPNQNILRPYLWLNVGIFYGLYKCCLYLISKSSNAKNCY